MIFKFFITFSLLISLSSASSVVDFCVADLSLPSGPAGYPCKNPQKVTVDDFIYPGALGVPGNTSNPFKVAITQAVDQTLPGLNGLGLTMARLDIDVGGVIPVHTHRASELLTVIEGTLLGGFIDSNSKAYYKTLNKGDTMIFPESLLHFLVNIGETKALGFVGLNSQKPGVQVFDFALFGNDLPSAVVQKITALDPATVKTMKKIFGGSN